MATEIWVNIGSGNGLLPNGTKPLPEPMVDLSSVEFCGIHLTTILLLALKVSIHEMSSKITFLKLQPHLPGANELKKCDFGW